MICYVTIYICYIDYTIIKCEKIEFNTKSNHCVLLYRF